MLNICAASKVLSVKDFVADSEHSVPRVANFVLLSDVAHVEKLLVVEDIKLAGAVEVETGKYWGERPNNKLLHHKHS